LKVHRVAVYGKLTITLLCPQDYYAELGVRQDASHDDIKRAFRELSKQHHPDKTSSAVDAKAAHDRYVRIRSVSIDERVVRFGRTASRHYGV
jgi:preprotein translocase subunit Sec63